MKEFTITGLTDVEINALLNALDNWGSTAAESATKKIEEQTGMK